MNRSELLKLEPLMRRVLIVDNQVQLNTKGLGNIGLAELNEICKLHLPVEVTHPAPIVLTGLCNVLFERDLTKVFGMFNVESYSVSIKGLEFTLTASIKAVKEEGEPVEQIELVDSVQLSGRAERFFACRILNQVKHEMPLWQYRDADFQFSFGNNKFEIKLLEENDCV